MLLVLPRAGKERDAKENVIEVNMKILLLIFLSSADLLLLQIFYTSLNACLYFLL